MFSQEAMMKWTWQQQQQQQVNTAYDPGTRLALVAARY
jgi:hypothetical protein